MAVHNDLAAHAHLQHQHPADGTSVYGRDADTPWPNASPIDEDTLDLAQDRLGYRFSDPALLAHALTHASIADSRAASNERLEFLGDAVLGMVVCEIVFDRFGDLLEGEMTKIKSTVVSRATCAQIAREMRLCELLATGKGMRTHDVLPQSISAAVFEAVIGAIRLDGGNEAARDFLAPLVLPLIDRAEASGHQQNFKSVLQHHAQQVLGDTPTYAVLDEKGPDHAKCFEVAVEIGARRFPSRWGPSKKEAEQQAALVALHELGLAEEDDDGEIVMVKPEQLNGTA